MLEEMYSETQLRFYNECFVMLSLSCISPHVHPSTNSRSKIMALLRNSTTRQTGTSQDSKRHKASVRLPASAH